MADGWEHADVCFWHIADIPLVLTNVRYRGYSGRDVNGPVMSANDPKRTLRRMRGRSERTDRGKDLAFS